MVSIFLIGISVVATAFVWHRTIQGYRTGVLYAHTRIERRVSPRLYAANLVALAILSLVMLGATALLIYGETHPEWHAKRAAPLVLIPKG